MLRNVTDTTKVLSVFCATEMWERYGFYVVQALLALYLSLHLQMSDAETYALVGSFTALTYISPVIGGWVADHFLGQKKAVLTGAILLACSYVVIAFASSVSILLCALALIATGTGLLKPNISALLGKQYTQDDPRRNSGFTIFYLGITVGIILGTILPIQLQHLFGWKTCFLSASIGAIFAFFVFFYGIRKLHIQEYATSFKYNMLINWLVAATVVIVSFFVFYGVLLNHGMADGFFILVVIVSTLIVLRIAKQETGIQRYKTLALLLLFTISAFFWAFYFEMFLALTLFITRVVEPNLFGMEFPAPYYVAVQSFGMIVFGLILSKLWVRMHYKNVAYAVSVKFTCAILFMFVAYLIILSVSSSTSDMLISVGPVLGAYLMISIAELLLSPIGLSAVTQLASEKVVSTMMGIFLVSLGIGGFLSGTLAQFVVINDLSVSLVDMKAQYFQGFRWLLVILGVGLVLTYLLSMFIRRLTHAEQEETQVPLFK